MEIQMIKDDVIMAFVGRDELSERGFTERGLGSDFAQKLAREVFSELGRAVDGELSVDVYINGCGLMMFAEAEIPKKYAVLFSSLENLLAYVGHLPKDDARLVLFEGEYCLISGHLSPVAEDYGEVAEYTEEMSLSKVLIEKDAISSLCTCFKL